MDREEVKSFFEDNAAAWVLNGYNDDGYNYPTALNRLNVILKILSKENKKYKIADLGCGGGQVSMALAQAGHTVVGIDESENMIELSNSLRESADGAVKENVSFKRASILENGEEDQKYDVCIAMGVIGYFEKDEQLFNEVKRLLKPGGIFLVSCRNRLFNMQSISFRTINEIKDGNAVDLIEEIESLYSQIPVNSSEDFVGRLKNRVSDLPEKLEFSEEQVKAPATKAAKGENYKPFYEPRQHTPKRLSTTASECGFDTDHYYGIHPHLIDPNLNKLLPPKVFNQISTCLEALEDHPVSLAISSVFIGAFVKK